MHHVAARISLPDGIPNGMRRSISASAASRLTRPPVSNLQGAHVPMRPTFKGGAYNEP